MISNKYFNDWLRVQGMWFGMQNKTAVTLRRNPKEEEFNYIIGTVNL